MFRLIVAVLVLLALGQSIAPTLHAQTKAVPGTKVGHLQLSGFLDSIDAKHSIDEQETDLILLDFWNTSCGSCIAAFPKLDSIQQQFGERVKIFLVTKNTAEEIRLLFGKIKIKKPTLPFIVSDSVLFSSFPHTTVPHHVWIDGRTKEVKYISEGYNTSIHTVEQFLQGVSLSLHYKNELVNFNARLPFLAVDAAGLIKNVELSSSFLRKVDEYGGSVRFFNYMGTHERTGLKIINADLLELYKIAYGGSLLVKTKLEEKGRVLLRVKDRSRFEWPADKSIMDQWAAENLYGYESLMPLSRKGEQYKILQEDMARVFPYNARLVKRKVVCWVLKQSVSALNHDHKRFISDDGMSMTAVNDSVIYERVRAYYQHLDAPVVSELDPHLFYNLDLSVLTGKKLTQAIITDALRKSGYHFFKQERLIDVLVITDKK